MARRPPFEQTLRSWLERCTLAVSYPFLALSLLHPARIHPAYRLTWRDKLRLARRLKRTTGHIQTGTSARAHLVMAAKILSVPPDVEGVIVEAGCWKGGTSANLSIIADLAGRDLIVYDSFEGLPAPAEGDRWANPLGEGAFRGDLDEVRSNVATHGVVERCQFRKGWFDATLPHHTEPIVAAFLDVDHQASMHQCLLGLWPHLVDQGYLFIDEYVRLDYCAVFFSERYWRTYFDRPPPGLMGAGTGAGVGQVFAGPYRQPGPFTNPQSLGWTRKDFYGAWDYFPDDVPSTPLPGGPGAAHGPEGWYTTTVPNDEHAESTFAAVIAADPDARARLEATLRDTEEGRRKLADAMERKARADQPPG